MLNKNFLKIISNLSKYHREHEKFYGQNPLNNAVKIQNASKTLKTLADTWNSLHATKKNQGNPYMGCEDLNNDPQFNIMDYFLWKNKENPLKFLN